MRTSSGFAAEGTHSAAEELDCRSGLLSSVAAESTRREGAYAGEPRYVPPEEPGLSGRPIFLLDSTEELQFLVPRADGLGRIFEWPVAVFDLPTKGGALAFSPNGETLAPVRRVSMKQRYRRLQIVRFEPFWCK